MTQLGCPPSLEVGQVWELNVDGRLEPSVLLQLYVGKFRGNEQDYWRCLSLESGKLFSATTRRWDQSYQSYFIYRHRPITDAAVGPLVGRRLL